MIPLTLNLNLALTITLTLTFLHRQLNPRYKHTVEEGPTNLDSGYGIDMAERVGVDRSILHEVSASSYIYEIIKLTSDPNNSS